MIPELVSLMRNLLKSSVSDGHSACAITPIIDPQLRKRYVNSTDKQHDVF